MLNSDQFLSSFGHEAVHLVLVGKGLTMRKRGAFGDSGHQEKPQGQDSRCHAMDRAGRLSCGRPSSQESLWRAAGEQQRGSLATEQVGQGACCPAGRLVQG